MLPRIRIVKRASWENPRTPIIVASGLTLGLMLSALLGVFTPAGPLGVLSAFLTALSPSNTPSIILFSAPIALSAIGLALAYRAGFYTIGAEGQVLLGAVASMYVSQYSGLELSSSATLALSLLAGGAIGALYSLIPVALRLYARANEVLTSLMLNYVAMYIVNYLVSGPWSTGMFTKTEPIPPSLRAEWMLALMVLALLTTAYWVTASRTKLGLEINAYGASPRAAKTYGASTRKVLLAVGLLSGFSAGLGGSLMLHGFQYALYSLEQPPGYGYMGVLAAWLASKSIIGSVLASIFFSYLMVSTTYLQYYSLSFNTVLALQAIMVLSVTGASVLSRYRVTLNLSSYKSLGERRRGVE